MSRLGVRRGGDQNVRRVYYYNGADNSETLYLYGAGGKKLATYNVGVISNATINILL